jgi:divalent metal cation (Fe/Co/Zn/Cd) transporter
MQPGYVSYSRLVESIRRDAQSFDRIKGIDSIYAFEFGDYAWVVLDIEVSENESLGEAHQIASDFENHLMEIYASVKEVTTHVEPVSDTPLDSIDLEKAKETLLSLFEETELLDNCHDIRFFPLGDGTFNVTLHCNANPDLSIKEVHHATVLLEHRIHEELPGIIRIVIHVEPEK